MTGAFRDEGVGGAVDRGGQVEGVRGAQVVAGPQVGPARLCRVDSVVRPYLEAMA